MMSHLSHEIFNHPIKALVDEALSPAHRAQCVSVLPRQQQALQEALLSSLPADEQPKSGGAKMGLRKPEGTGYTVSQGTRWFNLP